MKKIIMLLAGLLLTGMVQAAPMFKQGVNYDVVKEAGTAKPEVLEFFSHYCPHCYHFEPIISDLKKSLSTEVSFKRNPVSFLGGQMGAEVQRTYAVATLLGVEDKLTPVLFKRIQEDRNPPKDRADLKAMMVGVGVDGKEFDGSIDSFAVNGMVSQYNRSTQEMQIKGVPAIVINGRYLIKTESVKSEDEFKELVKFLLAKKD